MAHIGHTSPNEPTHVHVDRDDSSAKFWLVPVELVRNLGSSRRELATLNLGLTEGSPLWPLSLLLLVALSLPTDIRELLTRRRSGEFDQSTTRRTH